MGKLVEGMREGRELGSEVLKDLVVLLFCVGVLCFVCFKMVLEVLKGEKKKNLIWPQKLGRKAYRKTDH